MMTQSILIEMASALRISCWLIATNPCNHGKLLLCIVHAPQYKAAISCFVWGENCLWRFDSYIVWNKLDSRCSNWNFSSCSFEKGYKTYKVLLADFDLSFHSRAQAKHLKVRITIHGSMPPIFNVLAISH